MKRSVVRAGQNWMTYCLIPDVAILKTWIDSPTRAVEAAGIEAEGERNEPESPMGGDSIQSRKARLVEAAGIEPYAALF
jgi:hypothetical protein